MSFPSTMLLYNQPIESHQLRKETSQFLTFLRLQCYFTVFRFCCLSFWH